MWRLLVCVTVCTGLLVPGCGATSPELTPTPSASPQPAADLPPSWVQHEAAWQALDAGDAHPSICRWTYAAIARTNSLEPPTAQLTRLFPASFKVYIVIVYGQFPPDPENNDPFAARAMYLVLLARNHYYCAFGFLATQPKLAAFGPLHSYVPEPATAAGIWGHAMFAGGPPPGGPWPLAHVHVGIWKGLASSIGTSVPWRAISSDGDGFFFVRLPAGVYTMKLLAKGHGSPVPATVTVRPDQPTAVGVYGQGM